MEYIIYFIFSSICGLILGSALMKKCMDRFGFNKTMLIILAVMACVLMAQIGIIHFFRTLA